MKGFALAGIKSGWLHTISEEALDALLQLCEDWQKHAFAVWFTAAVRLLTR